MSAFHQPRTSVRQRWRSDSLRHRCLRIVYFVMRNASRVHLADVKVHRLARVRAAQI